MERRDPAKERYEAHTGNSFQEVTQQFQAGLENYMKLINPTPQRCFSEISNIELTPPFSE